MSDAREPIGPILIGGDGRSGTTLVASVLDAHPDLAVGPELHFRGPPNLGTLMLEGVQRLSDNDPAMTSEGVKQSPHLGPALRFIRRAERFGVGHLRLKELIEEAMKECSSELESFEDRCRLVEMMGTHVANRHEKTIWGMKIMREIKGLDRYLAVWPGAKILHVIRDGRDVASSQIKDGRSWGYESVEEAADKWSQLLGKVRRFAEDERVEEIRYEDIVTDPKGSLYALLDFIGVARSERVLSHEEFVRVGDSGVRHPSAAAVGRPLNSESFGRYRRDLTPEEVSAFESTAGKWLREYGYELSGEGM